MSDHAFIMTGAGRTVQTPRPRYEFRCWPRRKPRAISILQQRWNLTGAETRDDIYILSPISDACLVKLRDGRRLEVKYRGPDHDVLQRWTLSLQPRFPLSSADFLEIAVSLGLAELPDDDATLSVPHLFAALWSAPQPVRLMTIRKSRLVFTQGSCRAEITRAEWSGRRALTVAVEDPDRDSARAAVDALGIAGHPNLSYGEALWPRRLNREHFKTG